MTSAQPILNAMNEVNKELSIHFGHLANPEVKGSQRESIGRFAAEGVRRGFTVIDLHQFQLQRQLDLIDEGVLADL